MGMAITSSPHKEEIPHKCKLFYPAIKTSSSRWNPFSAQRKPPSASAIVRWWAPSDGGSQSAPTLTIWNWTLSELTIVIKLFSLCYLIYHTTFPINLTAMLLIYHSRPPAPLRLNHSAWLCSIPSHLRGIRKKISTLKNKKPNPNLLTPALATHSDSCSPST